MSNGYYYSGIACLNGHELDGYVGFVSRDSPPRPIDRFCPMCGEPTVTKCEHCQTDIRGKVTDGFDTSPWYVAANCHSCGQPYPWTRRKTEALAEAISEMDELDPAEREKLKQSIPDIVAQTPKSETAALRFKKAVAKAGSVSGEVLMKVLTSVAAEGVKKLLGM